MTTVSINEALKQFAPRLREYQRRLSWQKDEDRYLPGFTFMSPGFFFAKLDFCNRCLDDRTVFSSRRVQRSHVSSGASSKSALGFPNTGDESPHEGRGKT